MIIPFPDVYMHIPNTKIHIYIYMQLNNHCLGEDFNVF